MDRHGWLQHALDRLRSEPLSAAPKLLANGIKRRLWNKTEVRLYVYAAERIQDLPNPQFLRRDCWADVELYERTWWHQQPKEVFLEHARRALASGSHIYTLAEGGALLHYGWLTERVPIAREGGVGLGAELPPESASLFDFFTHPGARGRGIYRNSLHHVLHESVELAGARQTYISVLADNAISRRVIESVGFEYRMSLIRERRLGFVRRYALPPDLGVRVCPLESLPEAGG